MFITLFISFNKEVSANREIIVEQSQIANYFLSEKQRDYKDMNPFILMGLKDTYIGDELMDSDYLAKNLRPYILNDLEDNYKMYALRQDGEIKDKNNPLGSINNAFDFLDELNFLDSIGGFDEVLDSLGFIGNILDSLGGFVSSIISGVSGLIAGTQEEHIRASKIIFGLDYSNYLSENSLENYDWWRGASGKIKSFVSGLFGGSGKPTTEDVINESIEKIVNRTNRNISKTYPDYNVNLRDYDSDNMDNLLDMLRRSIKVNNMPIDHQTTINIGGLDTLNRDFPNNHFAVDIRNRNKRFNNSSSIIRHNLSNYIITQEFEVVKTTNDILAGANNSNEFSFYGDLSKDYLFNYINQIFNNDFVYSNEDIKDFENLYNDLNSTDDYNKQKEIIEKIEEKSNETQEDTLSKKSEVIQQKLVPDIESKTLNPFIKSITKELEEESKRLFERITKSMQYLYPTFDPNFKVSRLEFPKDKFIEIFEKEIKNFEHIEKTPIDLLKEVFWTLDYNFNNNINQSDYKQNNFKKSKLNENNLSKSSKTERKIEDLYQNYNFDIDINSLDIPYNDLEVLKDLNNPYNNEAYFNIINNIKKINDNIISIKDFESKEIYNQLPSDFEYNIKKNLIYRGLKKQSQNELNENEFEKMWFVLDKILESNLDLNYDSKNFYLKYDNFFNNTNKFYQNDSNEEFINKYNLNDEQVEIFYDLITRFNNKNDLFNSFYEMVLENVNMEFYENELIEIIEYKQEELIIKNNEDIRKILNRLHMNNNAQNLVLQFENNLSNESLENITNNFELIKETSRLKINYKIQKRIYQNMLEFIITRNKLNYSKEYFEDIYANMTELKNEEITDELTFKENVKEILQYNIVLNLIKNRYIEFGLPYYYQEIEYEGFKAGYAPKDNLENLSLSMLNNYISEINGSKQLETIVLDLIPLIRDLKELKDLLKNEENLKRENIQIPNKQTNLRRIKEVLNEFEILEEEYNIKQISTLKRNSFNFERKIINITDTKDDFDYNKTKRNLKNIFRNLKQLNLNNNFNKKVKELNNLFEQKNDFYIKNLGKEANNNLDFLRRNEENYDNLLYRFFHLKVYETQSLVPKDENYHPLIEDSKYSLFRDENIDPKDLVLNSNKSLNETRSLLNRSIDYTPNFEEFFYEKEIDEKYLKGEYRSIYESIPRDSLEEKEKWYKNLRNRILERMGILNEELQTFDEITKDLGEVNEEIFNQGFKEVEDSKLMVESLNNSLPFLATNYEDLMEYNFNKENMNIIKKNNNLRMSGMESELIKNVFEYRGINTLDELNDGFNVIDDLVKDNVLASYSGTTLTFIDMYIWNMLDDFDYEDLSQNQIKEKRAKIRAYVLELIEHYKVENHLTPKIIEKEIKTGDLEVISIYFEIFDNELVKKLRNIENLSINYKRLERHLNSLDFISSFKLNRLLKKE